MPLSDPINDADAICAAIDADENGEITVDEFEAFLAPTVKRLMDQGRQPLDIDEILQEAFKSILAHSKEERNMILETFMQSMREVPEASDPFNRGWVNEIYDDMYRSPSDPTAPKYQCKRVQFLKNSLSAAASPPKPAAPLAVKKHILMQRSMPNVRSRSPVFNFGKINLNNEDQDELFPPRFSERRVTVPTTWVSSSSKAPNEECYKKFCSVWLEKIKSMQHARVQDLWKRRTQS
jgi:hypothetical protein